MQSIGKKWSCWKHEAKNEGYMRYDNDANRLAHRPERVTEHQWRCLVYHWSTPEVQVLKYFCIYIIYTIILVLLNFYEKEVIKFCFRRLRVLRTSKFGPSKHYYTRLAGCHIICFMQRFNRGFINDMYFS